MTMFFIRQRFPRVLDKRESPALLRTFLAITAAAGLLTCTPQDSSPQVASTPTGKVALYMHDDPHDAQAVWVTVDHVNFKQCDGPFVSAPVAIGVLNLLDLRNGALAQLLHDAALPVGRYCELRLVLAGQSTLVDNSGQEHVLKTPSATSSGYKIKGEFQVIPGGMQTILTVDFDVAESIHKRGKKGYILEPVIRLDSVVYETEDGGSAPPGEYLDYKTFTVTPDASNSVDLGGGSLLYFSPGSVVDATTFTVTRWVPSSPDIRSDIYRFSPHYRFILPPRLSLAYQDDGRPGRVLADYTVLKTDYGQGLAMASLSHFTQTPEVANPCANVTDQGFHCDATGRRLSKCNGAGNETIGFECDCVSRGDNVDDGCFWSDAPWEGCLELTPFRDPPYHDGSTFTNNKEVALDFVPSGDPSASTLLCGFEKCEVHRDCRTSALYGSDVCMYELRNGVKSGRWIFVAHLDSFADNIVDATAVEVDRGTIIGTMGSTGNATGVHFHIEFGASGDASKVANSGDFSSPITSEVIPKLPICGGQAPQKPLDTIPPAEPAPVTPPPISTICDKPPAPSSPCQIAFPDVVDGPDCWYCMAVTTLACSGVIQGYNDGKFRPSDPVSRAELLKLVLLTAFPCEDFSTPPLEAPFPDVPVTNWAAPYVAFAKLKGIASGATSPNYQVPIFDPNRPVYRQEAAKIIIEAGESSLIPKYSALFAQFAALPPNYSVPDADEFQDVTDPVGQWYYKYVYSAKDSGVFLGYTGQNRFGVDDYIVRAQAVTAVHRAAGY